MFFFLLIDGEQFIFMPTLIGGGPKYCLTALQNKTIFLLYFCLIWPE